MENYYQFRISLNGVTPEVWRTFQVSELHSLFDLHQVIQVVMGWENDHLFQFVKDGKTFSLIDEGDEEDTEVMDADDTLISELNLKVGDNLIYEYDFNDGWIHTLKVLKIVPLKEELLPIALAGENACPFEDCGGPEGYMKVVATLEDFDPTFFDIEEVNEILSDLDEEDWDFEEDDDNDIVDYDDDDDDIFDDLDDASKKN